MNRNDLIWKEMGGEDYRAMKEAFIHRRQARQLQDELNSVSYRQLYQYAQQPGDREHRQLADAIKNSRQLQDKYLRILNSLQIDDCIRARAAASSEQLPGGASVNGLWRYTLERSPEPPYEYILIVEVADKAAAPTRILVQSESLGLHEAPLDAPHRGVIQMIFDSSEELVRFLLDPDCVVKLW